MKKTVLLMVSFAFVLLLASGCIKQQLTGSQVGEETTGEDDALAEEIKAIEEQLEGNTEPTSEDQLEAPNEETLLPEEPTLEPAEDTTGLPRLEVSETGLVALNLSVKDADGDALTFLFSDPLNEQGRWQTDYGDAGEYVVTVTVTDGSKESKKKVLLVVKKNNVPPEITGLEDLTVAEGDVIALNPSVTDRNKDPVTLTYSEPLDLDGEWQTDFTSAGEYTITVTATDGEVTAEQSIRLKVTDVNQPPVIAELESALTVSEGELVALSPVVTDGDGDAVTVTISDPVGQDGQWQTSYTDHGEYVVTVTATDGKESVTQEVNVVITDVNVAPEIVDITLG